MSKAATKTAHKPRTPKNMDERFMGVEPDPSEFKLETPTDWIQAYNWYNYFHDSETAKDWTLSFHKNDKEIKRIPDFELRTIGWTCRLIERGFQVPDDIIQKIENQLSQLKSKYQSFERKTKSVESKTVSHDRRNEEAINEMEILVDEFLLGKLNLKKFDVLKWMKEKGFTRQSAKAILNYYEKWEPDDMVDAIIEAATTLGEAARKPRKKKIKPPSEILKTFQYQPEAPELGIKSIQPADILNASELWLYNTEKRLLTVLRGTLTVKGTTILGFEESKSFIKKVRKPEITIPEFTVGTKASFTKKFEGIKSKTQVPTGRTNKETILLKAFK